MRSFYHEGHSRHDPARLHEPDKPDYNTYYSEVARRGEIIYQAVKSSSLGPIDAPSDFGMEPIGQVHDHGLLTMLQSAYKRLPSSLDKDAAIPRTFFVGRRPSSHHTRSIYGQLGFYSFDVGCPIFEGTWEAAYWSAQTALSAASHVLTSGEPAAYGLCRPPGHHAAADLIGGFCYLNNAAIAADWLVSQGQRVAILDIDFHHGNGTQAIFYNRSEVLFCSIHADPLVEYPYYWGYADEFGAGAGKGHNFNFPLPVGSGEDVYMAAFRQAADRIRGFVPDMLVISLGVDTVDGDPVGGFTLTADSLRRLGEQTGRLGLPTVVIQEGGYLQSELGSNVVAYLQGLDGVSQAG